MAASLSRIVDCPLFYFLFYYLGARRINVIVCREETFACVSIENEETYYRIYECRSVSVDPVQTSSPQQM